MNKSNNNKKQIGKDQQTIKSFDKLYRKSLQDELNDKSEYEPLCNNFTKYLDETKKTFFKNMNMKNFFE